MKKKKTIIVHPEWWSFLHLITDMNIWGQLFMDILRYSISGKDPGTVYQREEYQVAWELIKEDLEKDDAAYRSKCERRSRSAYRKNFLDHAARTGMPVNEENFEAYIAERKARKK